MVFDDSHFQKIGWQQFQITPTIQTAFKWLKFDANQQPIATNNQQPITDNKQQICYCQFMPTGTQF
ncbi:MAG: hypothetical protein EPGJADBJ_04659 [Saprospiraceae bacterium]|nr:hypothetical protein [Saprospiraceae bacterium]